ncbi:DUF6444 domain-containing protein [Pseudonocardia terrae]|uniref:DUF6444 domain-containing protein n=1 Tax=Pseudonocardia terrae TaxID=2905831 RepID=UPI0027E1A748|nr:DUF6444 domain-containing protein [Pseudonocardia terrae]
MQAGDGRPSYDELAALVLTQGRLIEELRGEVAQLRTDNEKLREDNERLRAENGELRRRLGMNSTNSSRPPSSDSPFVKPAPKSLRRKSGRRPGGQPGHPGATLALVDSPDERTRHEPGPCTGCGADLADAPEVGVERRQVFDLPPMTVRVSEHQLIARRCGCGTTTCGVAPDGVSAPTQYGPRLTAIVLYLYVGQFLSKKRTAQALAELFGTPLSEGTVASMTRSAPTGSRASSTSSGIGSPGLRWPGSTRPGCGWPARWPVCTAPAPARTR